MNPGNLVSAAEQAGSRLGSVGSISPEYTVVMTCHRDVVDQVERGNIVVAGH